MYDYTNLALYTHDGYYDEVLFNEVRFTKLNYAELQQTSFLVPHCLTFRQIDTFE
jgi:hypothetical protein